MSAKLPIGDFLKVLEMLKNGETYREIMRVTNVSYPTIGRISAAYKCIQKNDIDALMDLHNRNCISTTVYEYARNIVYENLDRLTTPDSQKKQEDENTGKEKPLPEWFLKSMSALPDISALLKTVALAIDFALENFSSEK